MDSPRYIIEPLESRIAPASLTFTDVDGDKVTITTSTGSLVLGENVTVLNGHLLNLDLTAFTDGVNVSIVATKTANGDGYVDVGRINATGVNLGTVTVDGDLTNILAGDGSATVAAVKSLKVHSMGVNPPPVANFDSSIDGTLGSLTVTTDVKNIFLTADDIGSVTIGGSLFGGTTANRGEIFAINKIGNVTIGGDLVGGTALQTGIISGDDGIGKVVIKGSIYGGGGEESGALRANASGATIASISVGGDVIGGNGVHSARLYGSGGIGPVTIGGDLRGSTGDFSARILAANGNLGAVSIGGSLVGGAGDTAGAIEADGAGVSVTIKGDILGGSGEHSALLSFGSLNALTVGGTIRSTNEDANGSAFISVGGKLGTLSLGSATKAPEINTSSFLNANEVGVLKTKGDLNRDLEVLNLGSLSVGGNLDGAAQINGTLGSAKIGKELSGRLYALNDVGPAGLTIGGDLSGVVIVGNPQPIDPLAPVPVPTLASAVPVVKIGGSIPGGTLTITGAVKTFSLAGDILGGEDSNSGLVNIQGNLGTATIGGGVYGGQAGNTGLFGALGTATSIKVGRDVVGGASNSGGVIAYGALGSLTIGGSVRGSEGFVSGIVGTFNGALGSLKIGKDLVGGSGGLSGVAGAGLLSLLTPIPGNSLQDIGSVTIGGSVLGGSLSAEDSVNSSLSGVIIGNNVGSVTVGKDIRAGQDLSNNADFFGNASISAAATLGTVTVKGGVYGSSLPTGDIIPTIGAAGVTPAAGATSNVVIKSISIGKNFEYASITAGVGPSAMTAKSGQQIGAITIGGNMVASTIAASVTLGADGIAGTADDQPVNGALLSKIASVTVKGRLLGTSTGGDSFYIEAGVVGPIKVGAQTFTPPASGTLPLALSTTGDVFARVFGIPE